jgi:uncharacterized protein
VAGVTLVFAAIAFLLASLAIGLTGYGFGLVAMGFLPYVFTVAEANAVVVPLGWLITVVALVPLRRHVSLAMLWPLFLGAVVGVPLGVVYLVRLDERILRVSLGVIILLALAASLYVAARTRRETSTTTRRTAGSGARDRVERTPRGPVARLLAVAVGVVSGSFGGAFSVSGPPVVVYINEVHRDKTVIKANLLAYFVFLISVRVPLLVVSDVLTADLLLVAVLMLPSVALGLWVGTLLHNRLPTHIVRYCIQSLLAVSAVLLIVGA